jgi:hypothetical protein
MSIRRSDTVGVSRRTKKRSRYVRQSFVSNERRPSLRLGSLLTDGPRKSVSSRLVTNYPLFSLPPTPRTMPTLRGSTPLNHIESVHLTGEESTHHQAESDDSVTGSFDDTVIDASPDAEKGDVQGEVGGVKRRRMKRQTTGEWERTSAETREWKDDIVLFDSQTDVRTYASSDPKEGLMTSIWGQPACPKNWSMRRRVGITVSFPFVAGSRSY